MEQSVHGGNDDLGQSACRNAEADEIERHDGGKSAEDIAIERCQRTDRAACRARHHAGERHEQPPDQHDDLGHHEDEDVDENELGEHLRPLVGNQRQQEEGAAHGRVVHEDEGGKAQHEKREDAPAESERQRVTRGGGIDPHGDDVIRLERSSRLARKHQPTDGGPEQRRGGGNHRRKDDFMKAAGGAEARNRCSHE